MPILTDGEVLLRAILDDPADDLPRLAYADWCEGQDDIARAEFIRVQLEIARLEGVLCHQPGAVLGDGCNDSLCPRCGNSGKLAWRERELLESHAGGWVDGLPESLVSRICPSCVDRAADWGTGVVECRRCDSTGFLPDYDRIEFHRGFVRRVELPLADFLAHAVEIFARCPVEEVRLTDRESYYRSWYDADLYWSYGMAPESNIPRGIFSLLSGEACGTGEFPWRKQYGSREAANAALSAACVAWGRKQAKERIGGA